MKELEQFLSNVVDTLNEMSQVRGNFQRNMRRDFGHVSVPDLCGAQHLPAGILDTEEDEVLTRISTKKLCLDTAELRIRSKQVALQEAMRKWPYDINELLNQAFEDTTAVKVSDMEVYPSLDGFTFGILASVLVLHKIADLKAQCTSTANAYFIPPGADPMCVLLRDEEGD